jgi:YbbR domain-containing protein
VTVRKLPSDILVTSAPSEPVKVTLRGPRTILDGLDERKTRLAVDLAGASPGDARVELSADMIRPEIPRRLKAVQIEPARLRLRLERLVRRRVQVRADLAGMPGLGYTVTESHVTPSQVEVSGPASKVDDLKEITTEPIDLRGLTDNVARDVALAWAGSFVTFSPDHVRVTVGFEEVVVTRAFRSVPVGVVPAGSARVHLTPSRAGVTVRGPQRVLHNFKLPDDAVTVDVDGLPPGVHRLPLRVELASPLEVVSRQPETIAVQVGGKGGR